MLNEKEKKRIHGLMLEDFTIGVDIPLAKVALYLKDKNINYTEFGFKKIKLFLNGLEFLELKSKKEDGHVNDYVVIKKEDDMKKKGLTAVKQVKTKKPEQVLSKKEKTITIDDKKSLFQLFQRKFKKDTKYPIKDFVSYLYENGILISDYGYTKAQDFFTCLKPYVLLEKKDGQYLVSLDGSIDAKDKEKKNTPVKNTNARNDSLKKIQKTEKLPDTDFFIPENILTSLKNNIVVHLEDSSLERQIWDDYQKTLKAGKIRKKDNNFIFPLSLETRDHEKMIGAIKKSTTKTDYEYFLSFVGCDREKPKDALENDIYFPDFDKNVKSLSLLARKEKWCYHNSSDPFVILKIYLKYTYYRLEDQDLVMFDEKSGYAAFNTGLMSPDYEDIYAIMVRNDDKTVKQKYLFQGFTVSASQGLGKILVEHFNPLPNRAEYITSSDQLYYDIREELHTDDRHIIIDNIDRFPMSFLSAMLLPFAKEKKIVDTILKTRNENEKARQYARLEDAIASNQIIYSLLKTYLDSAIDKSLRMVEHDYRMALPSFFPTRNVVSLMLPLSFGKDGVDAVLLVEKTASGNYQGQTILTPKQCYVNARIISTLENTYLDPSKIED